MQAAMPESLGDQLIAALPRLRSSARGMKRDHDRANELVQDTTLKALVGEAGFQAGSNFTASINRIQRNEFISGLRRAKPMVTIDPEDPALPSHRPRQEDRLVMREFLTAFALPRDRRAAPLLAEIEKQPHTVIAAHAGVSVGIKSRIWRGRQALKQLLPS